MPNKNRLTLAMLFISSFSLYSCGGSSSDTATSANLRTISGSISGYISNIASVTATNTATGSSTTVAAGALTSASSPLKATGTSATYSLSLPTGQTYNVNLVDAYGSTLATMAWANSPLATASATTALNVTAGTTVDIGNATVPATADPYTTTLVSSATNPLAFMDSDSDGVNDFADNDDDNDNIPDVSDTDDNGDGVNDADTESDTDGDGAPDISDADTVEANSDTDNVSDIFDTDDNGDGVLDNNDIDGDGIANADDPDVDGDGVDNENDTDVSGDGASSDAYSAP